MGETPASSLEIRKNNVTQVGIIVAEDVIAEKGKLLTTTGNSHLIPMPKP